MDNQEILVTLKIIKLKTVSGEMLFLILLEVPDFLTFFVFAQFFYGNII